MSLQFLFRQITGNIPTEKFWVGFVARFMHTVDSKSVPGCYGIEISALGLSVAEDKRFKNGFAFPIDLRNKNRTDGGVVQRLYVGMEDPELVFTEFEFLESVDFVFAAKGGATLSELDGACSVTVFDRVHPEGVVMDIYPAHAGVQAVRLPIIVAQDGVRSFSLGGQLSAIDNYPGDMAGYCEQQSKPAKPASPAALPPSPLPAAPVPPVQQALQPPPSIPEPPAEPVDLAKKPKAPRAARVKAAAPRVAASATADIAEAVQAVVRQAVAQEAAAPPPEPQGNPLPPATSKGKSGKWKMVLAVCVAATIGLAWLGGSSHKEIAVAPTPAEIPSKAAADAKSGKKSKASTDASFANKPGAVATGAGALTPDAASVPQALVIPPVPHSGQTISREQLAAMGYPDHLAKVKLALASAKTKDSNGIDQAREWLRVNKQNSFLPANEQEAQNVRVGRRYFNEAIEKKIVKAQATNDKKELQEAAQSLNDFLLENFGSANAHLNLAVAYIESDQSKLALAPAFHTIVFNPEGANGWLQLGLVLAINGETENGAAAMCVTLQIAKYSPKTVAMFNRIEKGLLYAKPNVKEALAQTRSMCPGADWM